MLYLQKPKNFISMGVDPRAGIFHDMRLAKVSFPFGTGFAKS
jgi:hypothetical protein